MFEVFTDYFEEKRKQARELELKKALSKRISNLDESLLSTKNDCSDKIDYTEITIAGNRMRLKTEHITIADV